jgi:CDGSH-type Zn-finger protein
LRQLIGEQRYDKAMVQLMYMLPSEVRDAVLRRAERHGWNAAIAMDEYLAEQAERDVQPTWWGKVNAKIRALLRNMGFNVMLTDADVAYLLWRSRKKLMGDTAFDMATNAILKQAARKSAEADAWNEQAFKDAEMRDFEKGAMQRLRNRIGDAQNEYDSAMKSMAFKQRESWQDSMRSLKVFMDIIEKESGKAYEIRNRVVLCRCGESANKPYCDGTHAALHWRDELEKEVERKMEFVEEFV